MTIDDDVSPTSLRGSDFPTTAERFIGWLDRQVTIAGRGDDTDVLDVDPSSTFWLGRLAPEETVQASVLGDRGERLDPCAIGLRVRPRDSGPWTFTVSVSLRAWVKTIGTDDKPSWRRCPEVTVLTVCHVDPEEPEAATAREQIARQLDEAGAPGLEAEVRVEVEAWRECPELVITLVNTSPDRNNGPLDCTHLFETSLTIAGLATDPLTLEGLPDSFRYDRGVPALGINAGVLTLSDGRIQTTDTTTVDRGRPAYWNSERPCPDLSFATLSRDPLPHLGELVAALADWNHLNWSPGALDHRATRHCWSPAMRAQAQDEARKVEEEQQRLEDGLALLADPVNEKLLRAFTLMNQAIGHAAHGYDSWRPFQIGFLLASLRFLVHPEDETGTVDTVWFATGGGKTETYLGLLITTALYDRSTGKTTGISAWSRFPLRMLSLQQTQRFADALAGAELVRRAHRIGGAPFSIGFYVGSNGTPNRIPLEAKEGEADVYDDAMPARYQVLTRCPFCRGEHLDMGFDRQNWRLTHTCTADRCPWAGRPLPFYVVDDEIYRFLPTVVIGTLDKAALLSMQAASRGLIGPPLGTCTTPGHGYTYAPRTKNPSGCLVPGCTAQRNTDLPQPRGRYGPRLRLQDELHLLRDSLGAVDSHYESLLDHLQGAFEDATPCKIIASSATLTGYKKQVETLYQRKGRVFPQPGISSAESFWTVTTQTLNRRYVAVAPRGVTLEFVSDRTVTVLQQSIRRLLHEPDVVCREAQIDSIHVPELLRQYGTDVLYGTTLYDVEGALRSLDSNVDVAPLNSATLTGQTDLDEVRETLERLEKPEDDFDNRLHVIAASSMLSHGVDIARLNVMVMLGLPLTTAEFIQTTARVGRRWPGVVYVLHKIARERDAGTFRQFDKFVTQGDRFVEAIPVTRRSRRVLALTAPGLVEARRLHLHEPRSAGQRLTTVAKVRDYLRGAGHDASQEGEALGAALGLTGSAEELLRADLDRWLKTWWTNLKDPASGATWPNELSPTGPPMRSLRDVEESAPIHD